MSFTTSDDLPYCAKVVDRTVKLSRYNYCNCCSGCTNPEAVSCIQVLCQAHAAEDVLDMNHKAGCGIAHGAQGGVNPHH